MTRLASASITTNSTGFKCTAPSQNFLVRCGKRFPDQNQIKIAILFAMKRGCKKAGTVVREHGYLTIGRRTPCRDAKFIISTGAIWVFPAERVLRRIRLSFRPSR